MTNPAIIEIIKSKDAKKRYDFLLDGKVIAFLDFPNRWVKAAMAQAGDLQWQIRRKGWWKHTIEISAGQSPYSKWNAAMGWRGNISIRTDDNKQFHLKRKGFWNNSWIWINEQNETVVELKLNVWSWRKQGIITLNNTANTSLIWLSLVGWFIAICAREDGRAAAAAS